MIENWWIIRNVHYPINKSFRQVNSLNTINQDLTSFLLNRKVKFLPEIKSIEISKSITNNKNKYEDDDDKFIEQSTKMFFNLFKCRKFENIIFYSNKMKLLLFKLKQKII